MKDCRVSAEGRLGRITLDRRGALNALTMEMVVDLTAALAGFAADREVERVVIDSAAPGIFCAGGDIKKMRALAVAGEYGAAMDFFRAEFALNQAIADFPKPYVALIDGVCFGGGMGLSIHGRYRVVTDASLFAMPEVAIGYFPDVGASHFLSLLPPGFGLWLGLTGQRVKPDQALRLGLATHSVAAADLVRLTRELAENPAPVDDILASCARALTDSGTQGSEGIAACFAAPSLDEIVLNLRRAQGQEARTCLDLLMGSSAHSVRLTFSLISAARDLPLAGCLANELDAAESAIRHPDFVEGVRALLVDKDRNPRWQRTFADWHADHAAPRMNVSH